MLAEMEQPGGTAVQETAHPITVAVRLQMLDRAYRALVCDGKPLTQVAEELDIPYNTLRYHADKNKWQEARTEYVALLMQAQEGTDILDRAEAELQLAQEGLRRCRERAGVFEKFMQLKWAHMVGDTEEENFTDANGKAHVMRVPKATPKEMQTMMAVHSDLRRELMELAKFSDAKMIRQLRRLNRSRSTLRRRQVTAENELMTRTPPGKWEDEE